MTKEIKTFKYLINDYIYKINLKPESKYPDIVNIASGKRPKNQKEVLTRILKNLGYDIPTQSNFNTHRSVTILHKLLNNKKLTKIEEF